MATGDGAVFLQQQQQVEGACWEEAISLLSGGWDRLPSIPSHPSEAMMIIKTLQQTRLAV
jgi:hypothetical protein